MKRAALLLVVAGCGNLLGIDAIPYAGPADAPSDGRVDDGRVDGASAVDAGGPLFLTLKLDGAGSGAVVDDQQILSCAGTSSTCLATYPSGTVTLTPSPSAQNEFALWTDACVHHNTNDDPSSSPTPPCTLTGGGAVSVTARFEVGEVLNLVPDSTAADVGAFITDSLGNTCASGAACTFPFSPFFPVSDKLTVTQNSCAVFTGWRGGGCDGSAPTCTPLFNQNGYGNVLTVNYTFAATNGSGCSQ